VKTRIELRWVLAVYAVAYASVVVAGVAADLAHLPLLSLLIWPALVCAFWIIARAASFRALGSALIAVSAAAMSWVFGQAELVLEPRSMEAALYRKPLLLVVFGLGLLLVLVFLWARRDGAWRGLSWLAFAEFGVTVFAFYVITARASDPGIWARLQSLALIATGSLEVAVRVTCAWLLTMFIALRVRRTRPAAGT
jgi:hypothetical protein